ncbi:LAMI_0G16952g1_1 [Lachancea mirantina]|uniref:LAMI_0G16952g1_1 n=1 Tax=Lachancea mirantina TaxID=1230905 RepID=A0A1G4KCQ8_9SACH|nr:LAMI_0G16952g1_1 [Lachancea mirantina]
MNKDDLSEVSNDFKELRVTTSGDEASNRMDTRNDDSRSGQDEGNITHGEQQMVPNSNGSDEESDSSGEWSALPAIASYSVYNEKGELALPAQGSSSTFLPPDSKRAPSASPIRDNLANGGSTFGYTKLAGEEQAQRSYATQQKIDFLFNHRAFASSKASLNNSEDGFDEGDDDDDEGERYTTDLNSTDQLAVTKDLLHEKEIFAYLGAVNVLADEMSTELALTCLSTDIVGREKLVRRLHKVQKSMADWKVTVVSRLYEHMGISLEERRMVEALTRHGVELRDVCKCLKVNQVVRNPFEHSDHQTIINKTDGFGTNEFSDVTAEGGVSDLYEKSELNIDVSWTIICDLFLLLLADLSYDSRSRTLLMKFGSVLSISQTEICEFEKRVTDGLEMEQSMEDQVWNEQDHMKTRRKKSRNKKLCYVGLATIGGSLVLGLSGGLLAPVIGAGIAAGLSTVGITSAAGFLTGVGGTAVVAATSTAIGAKIGTEAMSKRMGSVRTFELSPLHNNRRVNLIVTVSGWMTGNDDDVRLPFSTVDPIEGDLYSLHWEPEMLKSTGQTINILASEIFTQTIQQILGATILTAFMSAIQMPMMLSKLGYLIDNPWNVSLDRAWAAGLILADTLISRNLGKRPVTLIGFSLGSRVIYSCLLELCKKGYPGLVENVIMFGSPIVYKSEDLIMAKSVVSGRFVNGFSTKDWILCYLFRATSGGFSKVIGISPVSHIHGIENFDCTELVEGHMAYRKKMPKLLKQLGISVLSEEFAEIEEASDPEQVERQRRFVHDLDEAQRKLSSKKKRASWVPGWMKPKKAKWQEMWEESTIAQGNHLNEERAKSAKTEDSAIVNTSALLKELNNIKEAMAHEKPVDNDLKLDTSTTDDDKKMNANTFQLLSAGKVVLPEDRYSFRKHNDEKVNFTFPDEF